MTPLLFLPMPPSTNHLYANVSGKGRRKTKRYADWITDSGWLLQRQRPLKFRGSVVLDLTCPRHDEKRRDVSNFIKAVEDLLVRHGVIEDDSRVWEVRARWGSKHAVCEVRVWPAEVTV